MGTITFKFKDLEKDFQEVQMPGGAISVTGQEAIYSHVLGIIKKRNKYDETRRKYDKAYEDFKKYNDIYQNIGVKHSAAEEAKREKLLTLWKEGEDEFNKFQLLYRACQREIFKNLEWVWKVPQGGSLTKRIAKRMYVIGKIRLTPEELTDLGNLISTHSTKAEAASFKIEKIKEGILSWNPGDYADSGSCFFGCRAHIADLFSEHPFYTLKIHTHMRKTPLARCILYKTKIENNKNDIYLLFNGYGKKGNQLFEQARMFAFAMGLNYKEIKMCNKGKQNNNLLWINNNKGFMIGATEILAKYKEYFFQIDETPYKQRESYSCVVCAHTIRYGEVPTVNDIRQIPSHRIVVNTVNEPAAHVCRNCAEELLCIDVINALRWVDDCDWLPYEKAYCLRSNTITVTLKDSKEKIKVSPPQYEKLKADNLIK